MFINSKLDSLLEIIYIVDNNILSPLNYNSRKDFSIYFSLYFIFINPISTYIVIPIKYLNVIINVIIHK